MLVRSDVTRVCGANIAAASPALVGGTRVTSTTHAAGWGQLRRPLASPLRPPCDPGCQQQYLVLIHTPMESRAHEHCVSVQAHGVNGTHGAAGSLSPWARRWGQGHSEKWPPDLGPLPLPTRVRELRAGCLVELRERTASPTHITWGQGHS